jgi:hypothetical protein
MLCLLVLVHDTVYKLADGAIGRFQIGYRNYMVPTNEYGYKESFGKLCIDGIFEVPNRKGAKFAQNSILTDLDVETNCDDSMFTYEISSDIDPKLPSAIYRGYGGPDDISIKSPLLPIGVKRLELEQNIGLNDQFKLVPLLV